MCFLFGRISWQMPPPFFPINYQPPSTYTARMSVHRPAGGKSPPCPVQGAAVSDSAPAGSVGLVTTCWCWSKSTNSCNSWSAGSTPTSQPLKLLNIKMGVFVFSWSYQRSTHVPKLWYWKTQMRSVIFIWAYRLGSWRRLEKWEGCVRGQSVAL